MKVLRDAAGGVRGILGEAARANRVQTATVLTLLLAVLHGGAAWYFMAPLAILAGFGLLVPRLRTQPGFWLAVTCILAFGNFYNWFAVDNHKFLMTWWCLAIYCSLLAPDPEGMLAAQGRWLLALCFLFAVIWKILAPDYLSGSFFRQMLLTDPRFHSAAVYCTGTEKSTLSQNRKAFNDLTDALSDTREAKYTAGPRLNLVATLSTWWTVGIEALLALGFLLPSRTRFEAARHAILLVFLFTTYAVAPVVPYGWTLLVMGLAVCPPEFTRLRVGYMIAFFALQLYATPLRPTG